MKICSICKALKGSEDFHVNKSKRDGRQTKCKPCSSALTKVYYEANRTKLRSQISSRNKILRRENQYRLLEHLQKHPCVDCGETDPVVLDFDHVRGTKVRDLCRMAAWGTSAEKLAEEMNKCEVRCANCHRRKTAKQKKFFRYGKLLRVRSKAGREFLILVIEVRFLGPQPWSVRAIGGHLFSDNLGL